MRTINDVIALVRGPYCALPTPAKTPFHGIVDELGQETTNGKGAPMSENRFDTLTKELGTVKSRRSFMKTLAGGGLATALAAVGIAAVDVEEADAAGCRSRCKRRFTGAKRRNCLKRCGSGTPRTAPGTPIGTGTIADGQACTASAQCVNGNCASIDPVTGFGTCSPCPNVCDGLTGQFCCAASQTCSTTDAFTCIV